MKSISGMCRLPRPPSPTFFVKTLLIMDVCGPLKTSSLLLSIIVVVLQSAISTHRFLIALETSPNTGFMVRKRRKSLWGRTMRGRPLTRPHSFTNSSPPGSSRGFSLSNTAGWQRLALSNTIQSPFSIARSKTPSTHSKVPNFFLLSLSSVRNALRSDSSFLLSELPQRVSTALSNSKDSSLSMSSSWSPPLVVGREDNDDFECLLFVDDCLPLRSTVMLRAADDSSLVFPCTNAVESNHR
mmetsp:Transcript_21335/g.41379  ORF Transcript_21335/g.41379 Transcript_21335/m.41379 type:complete len:241 (+) Transcript_21335:534-1256(+)